MGKKWQSYHGADGECTYTDSWCRAVGLLEHGHPSSFTISEINVVPGQLSSERLLRLLTITLDEFKDCVVRVSFSEGLFPLFESMQKEGEIEFERQRSKYSDRLIITHVNSPQPPVVAPSTISESQKVKWWKFW